MAGKISDLFVNIGAKTDDFKKGVRETENEASGLSKTFSKIGGAIAGAFTVSTIVSFGKECVQLANIAEGVEAAFKRIGDQSTLEGLRKATKGTVSDLELMKAAVQANNFGIPLKNLGSLLEFAHQRAKDTGQSVDYLVQSIVLGIGRKSPLILDNLGISAVQLKEKMKGVASETASVADIAKAVGEIASDAMKKVGESAETSAERTARLNAAWENSKVLWGKAINTIKDGLLPTLVKLAEKSAEVAKNIGLVFKYGLNGAKAYQEAEYDVNRELENGVKVYLKTGEAKDEASAKQKSITEQLKIYNSYIKDTNDFSKYELQVMQFKIDMLKEMQRSLNATTQATVENGTETDKETQKTFGLIEIQKKKIEDLKKQIEQAPTTTFAAKLTNDLIQAETELTKLQQQIRSEAFGTPVGQGLKPMQGKTTTSVGSANLTPAFDENKMSSIANGYKSGAADIEQTNIDLSNSMSDVATTFADAVGQMAVGAMSMEDFGKTVAMAMVGFIKTLGEQMIAVGMAGIALEMSIENPYLALAAGLALVALAGAASATLKAGPGGSSGGSGYSTNSSAYNNSGGGLTVEIEGVVKGSDIYFTQKNYNKTLNSTVSRG